MSTKAKRRSLRYYNIAEVMHYYPLVPNDINEVTFTIRWEGYNDPNEYTDERWDTNHGLHANKIVLSYMLQNQFLRRFAEEILPQDFFVNQYLI